MTTTEASRPKETRIRASRLNRRLTLWQVCHAVRATGWGLWPGTLSDMERGNAPLTAEQERAILRAIRGAERP